MNPTSRFTGRAQAYAANRPGYPDAVFAALFEGLDAAALCVADIGAGTGISTALLAQRCAAAIAVEPNATMRAAAEPNANVTWVTGTAEQTGLCAASVDVAAAFQAFHWFDAQAAFAEFRRVARRRIAMVQYERDERQAFGAAYGSLIRLYMLDDTEERRMAALRRFAGLAGPHVRSAQIPGSQRLDRQGLIGHIDSSSYLPKWGEAATQLRADAQRLFESAAVGGYVDLPRIYYVQYVDR